MRERAREIAAREREREIAARERAGEILQRGSEREIAVREREGDCSEGARERCQRGSEREITVRERARESCSEEIAAMGRWSYLRVWRFVRDPIVNWWFAMVFILRKKQHQEPYIFSAGYITNHVAVHGMQHVR